MNLAEARTWMMNNPGKKITCSYFATNEWIMWDSEKLSFIFEDGCYPTVEWWNTAKNFNCEWHELKLINEIVGVAESPLKTFPRVNEFEVGASYRR